MPVVPGSGGGGGTSTTDIITLTEAKLALGFGDTSRDTLLELYITAISDLIDQRAGPVVQRTVTESFDGAVETVELRYKPVASVTSVTEYDTTTAATLTAQTNTAESASDYLFDPYHATITRRKTNNTFKYPDGLLNVVVTYTAGRYTDTSSVASRFKTAATILLAHVWRSEQGGGTQTYGTGEIPTFGPGFLIPNRVLELLGTDVLAPGFA